MRERPILFNTEMVKAILDGRKACTRRVVKGYIPKDAEFGYTTFTPKGAISCRGMFETGYPGYGEKFIKLPYRRGAILYVRETWSEWTDGYLYKAWTEPFPQPGQFPGIKWKPSIHMPKAAARIWLKVTDVRVERLQEMDWKDALYEGIDMWPERDGKTGEYIFDENPLDYFIDLWDSTVKKSDIERYGWDANPWVWVIEFERCEKPDLLEGEG